MGFEKKLQQIFADSKIVFTFAVRFDIVGTTKSRFFDLLETREKEM